MSLKRAGTRKATAGASSRARGYEVVQQGVQVIYPGEHDNIKSDIEYSYLRKVSKGWTNSVSIVFVPGLQGHPYDSWKSTKNDWNWMASADGIRGAFPKARILLYTYESAWQGQLRVNQFMDNISKTLLVALRSRREDCKKRPIVFIGHSMGGLVIAKAITILNAQPELCPVMFEAISATVFFGTPFAGAPAAAWASMYAYWAEKRNKATSSELLDLMKPGDEALRELKDEFRRVAAKTRYNIELLCFWEEQPTNFAEMAHLPGLFGLTKRLIPREVSEFVSKASATFEGDVPKYGLASNHRELVKFDNAKDGRWNFVENLLKKVIHGAYLTAKSRLSAARDIEWDSFKSVMEALDSARVHPSRLRKVLLRSLGESSMIAQQDDYIKWLGKTGSEAVKVDGLWVRGPEGRGKTGAMLAVLDDVESMVRTVEQDNGEPILFAYFLCDAATDYCTAEDCLKSLIWQLIEQEKALTTHAKDFVKEKGKNKSRATPTVENLWKSLQGMLADEFAGSSIYIVLSNLHLLPEDSDSTLKLLHLLRLELEGSQNTEPGRVLAKWFITSRPTYAIQKALDLERLRVINLEDAKFGNQFQKTLQKHAKGKVEKLEVDKKYNNALAWFARSLIGERAQNTSWIDITCLQLEELPEAESDLKVRRMLEAMPQDLNALLKNAWLQIFRTAGEHEESVKEMLRSLVITVEEPTEAELDVLCGLDGSAQDKQELRQSIEKCKPLVSVHRTVGFMNNAVRKHLVDNAKELLGLSAQEIARQHGLLALRSLSYLKNAFDFPETDPSPPVPEGSDAAGDTSDVGAAYSDNGSDGDDDASDAETDSEAGGESLDGDGSSYSEDDWDEESEPDPDPEAQILEDLKVLPYMIKNWLQHGSKATVGFADDLSLDNEFWKPGSLSRRRWLVEYSRNTKEFEYEDIRGMNALHIVAAIGFRQLLIALIENGHEDELDGRDGLNSTPLCFACQFGKADMVEELLDRKACINAGEEEVEDTPLHLAAEEGHVEVMRKLMLRGANVNAYSEYSGLVINSAISSGNLTAVELLVGGGVSLSIDRDDVETPLEQAASLCDVSMLVYLVEKYADRLPPEEYSKALIAAATAGSLEILNKLLPFEHSDNDYQCALDEAAKEGNWEITKVLLEKRKDLSCDKVFYEAATRTNDLEVLDALWEYTKGNISAETLDQSLYEATDNKKTDTVLLLLKFGADPNAEGDDYGNALTASAYDGTLDILKLLLDHGASVDSDSGWALQTAATEGHIEIVEELLSRGAIVNARTSKPGFPQQTALYGACELGREKVVDILIEHGADPDLPGGDNDYPITTAARNGQIEIIGKLISSQADVNKVSGDDGSTALIIVAKKIASLEPLQQLLEAGAEIDATDNEGNTALIAAASVGDDEFVNFLLARGADVMHRNNDGINAMQAATDADDSEATLNVLISHVSTILSGIEREMKAGNQAIVDVVSEARAVARELNNNDIEKQGSEAGSGHGSDADLASVTSRSGQDGLKDAPGEDREPHQSQDKLGLDDMLHVLQETHAEDESEELEAAKAPQSTSTIQQSPFRNAAELNDQIHNEIGTSTATQPYLANISSYTGLSDGYGYPGSTAAVQPALHNNSDKFASQVPFQQTTTWRQQAETAYDDSQSMLNHEVHQHSSGVDQRFDTMPQRNQETPVKRKPAPITYGGLHYPQDAAQTGNQAVHTPQHQPDHFIAYHPDHRQSIHELPSQNFPMQAQAHSRTQPASQSAQTEQVVNPGLRTSSYTQGQAQNRPLDDFGYGKGAHGTFDQGQRPDPIAYDGPGVPTQSQNSFSHEGSHYPPRPQPTQTYSSPAQLGQQQQQQQQRRQQVRPGVDMYNAMPPPQELRYQADSNSRFYQGANIPAQQHYSTPAQPISRPSSFFGVKNTFGQAKGRFFSANKGEDGGR